MIKKLIIFFLLCICFTIILFFALILLQKYQGKPIGFRFIRVNIAGTGSMYPTYPKKSSTNSEYIQEELMYEYPGGLPFLQKRLYPYQLKHGDIVAIENSQTKLITQEIDSAASGVVKRLIGLENDIIEFRGGYLYRNRVKLSENYLARQGSTFGSEKFPDCHEFVVPKGKIFVLGDNRTDSLDSRSKLDFVDKSDVTAFVPMNEQYERFGNRWENHQAEAHELLALESEAVLQQLNILRQEKQVPQLRHEVKLDNSARIRSAFFFDESKNQNLTMQEAMQRASYSNIVWGEIPLWGRFTSAELIAKIAGDQDVLKFVQNSNYQDFGMIDLSGNKNSCPTNITLLHFAGYVPAKYDSATSASWQNTQEKLIQIIKSWENINAITDEKKLLLVEIKNLLHRQLEISQKINELIKSKSYLSPIDEKSIQEFDNIASTLQEKTVRANSIN